MARLGPQRTRIVNHAGSVLALDAATYEPHALHRGDVAWLETNCYVDVWIEILHALGLEPLAGLGFTVRTDLEADQWTFYRFGHSDLEMLYGIEVVELNPWTSVLEQVCREVGAGRIPLVEVDSWFLPDTLSTAYKQHHVKTTIGVETIDPARRVLGYFHNSGYCQVEGDDFDGIFRGHSLDDDHLVPYIEVAKLDRRCSPGALADADAARRSFSRHVAWMPRFNPFAAYRDRFQHDVEVMRSLGPEAGGERFHLYAFAYFRQFGSAFSLAAAHLRWLATNGGVARVSDSDVEVVAVAYDSISTAAKTLQLRTARAAMTGKVFDGSGSIHSMAEAWQCGFELLQPTRSER